MPPFCSTFSKMTSASQSSRISRSICWCPELSPLRQSLPRDRDQYTAWPSSTVSFSDSAFIHAIIRISPLSASWAIAGTRPSSVQRISLSQSGCTTLAGESCIFVNPDKSMRLTATPEHDRAGQCQQGPAPKRRIGHQLRGLLLSAREGCGSEHGGNETPPPPAVAALLLLFH